MFTAHLLYKLNFICKYLLYKIALYVLFFLTSNLYLCMLKKDKNSNCVLKIYLKQINLVASTRSHLLLVLYLYKLYIYLLASSDSSHLSKRSDARVGQKLPFQFNETYIDDQDT